MRVRISPFGLDINKSNGMLAEWLKARDCSSRIERLPRFETLTFHIKRSMNSTVNILVKCKPKRFIERFPI